MKVKDLMQEQVFTVEPNDMIDRVFFLLHYEKIRHVPVVEKRRVVGIVSDRDLYKALGPRTNKTRTLHEHDKTMLYVIPRKVRHIMRRGVLTIEPDADAAKAASMMAKRKIGALPVVRSGKLVGIVTSTDLLRAFARAFTSRAAAETTTT
jgi:acetoin utilization protein AcuB